MQSKALFMIQGVLLLILSFPSSFVGARQFFESTEPATTQNEVESRISGWLKRQTINDRRLTVRDIRQTGKKENALQLTSLVKRVVVNSGFELAQLSEVEMEGKISMSAGNVLLSLRLVNEDGSNLSGNDQVFAFTLSKSLFERLEGIDQALPQTGRPAPSKGPENGKPNFSVKPEFPERWQINEETVWEVDYLDRGALQHVRLTSNQTGFIVDQSSWSRFWSMLKNGQTVPNVDFSTHALIVLYADSPTKINYKVFTRGGVSSWDFVRDDKAGEQLANNNQLHAVLLLLPRTPRRSLGVTVEQSPDGQGLRVKSVLANAPITRGVCPDGRVLSCESGDLITSINGRTAENGKQLADAVRSAGETIVLGIKDIRTGDIEPMVFYLY